MAVLTADQIDDLVTLTLQHLGEAKWSLIATDLQDYVAARRILPEKKEVFSGGYGVRWNVQVKISDSARDVGLYETDVLNVDDVMETAEVPWRYTETYFAYDLHEDEMNSGKRRLVNFLKVKRVDALLALAAHTEAKWWSKPATSTNKKQMFGVDYWMSKYPTATETPGFTGGNAVGFSSGPGGLSCGDYDNHKNFAGKYTTISDDDLLESMREAHVKTLFKSPVKHPSYTTEKQQYEIFCRYPTLRGFEDLAKQQSEDLGNDLAGMDGTVVFRRNPITWVPQLEVSDASTNYYPVYFINWNVLKPIFLRGWTLRQTGPEKTGGHNVRQVHYDMTWNSTCKDRRRLTVLSKGTDQP